MTLQTIKIETPNGTMTIEEAYNEYYEDNSFGVNWESCEECHEWVLYDWDGKEVGVFSEAEYAEEYVEENHMTT